MSYTRCLYLVTVVYCLSQPVLLTLVVFHPCVSPACAVLVISCVVLFYFTLRLLAFAAIGLFTTILLSDPCSVIQSTSTVYIIPRGAAYHQAKVATASGPQARFCMCVCVCEEVPLLIPLAHGEQANKPYDNSKSHNMKIKRSYPSGSEKRRTKMLLVQS